MVTGTRWVNSQALSELKRIDDFDTVPGGDVDIIWHGHVSFLSPQQQKFVIHPQTKGPLRDLWGAALCTKGQKEPRPPMNQVTGLSPNGGPCRDLGTGSSVSWLWS